MSLGPTGEPIVRIVDVHKSFGAVHVLRGMSMTVARGEAVCVIGPSGSGKSTLLRWVVERATKGAGGESLVLATADVSRPTLRRFFPAAMMPTTSDGTLTWLERLLSKLVEIRQMAVIDFGADASLAPFLDVFNQ